MNVLRQEIRTGLLVVFSLAVLFLVLLYLGAPGVFVPQKTYYVYLENAYGLKQGADVAVAGRKVGQVIQLSSPVAEDERPEPNLETMVEVRVSRASKIYKKGKVQVTSSSLLGEMFIDFTAGVVSSGEAPAKYPFVGTGPNNITDAVPKILDLLNPVVAEVTATLNVLQKTALSINQLTGEQGDLRVAMAEFRKVGSNLSETTGPTGPLRETLNNFSKLSGNDGKIVETLDNLRELTGPESSFARAMKNTEQFTANLRQNKDIALTLANTRQATADLDATIQELRFKFTAVGDNLEQASDTVKRQPWRLIWPSTKKYDETLAPRATPASRSTSLRASSRKKESSIRLREERVQP